LELATAAVVLSTCGRKIIQTIPSLIREAGLLHRDNESAMANRRSILKAGAVLAVSIAGKTEASPMKHVLMLGDSIFDNGAYVSGAPDVRAQLQSLMPMIEISFLARDGAVISDIHAQLGRAPQAATHVVVSIGGNDALIASGVLEERVSDVSGALERLRLIAEGFRQNYASMMKLLSGQNAPIAVCTIYEPRFPDPARRRSAATALSILNDVITREAFSAGASLIDLRLVCSEDSDFANAIEPSTTGGLKIARTIARFVSGQKPSADVFANP
jgi:GDSL-like Lipase/Acylhydrolase family